MTAGEYQSILFDIVGRADFAGLAWSTRMAKPVSIAKENRQHATLGAAADDRRPDRHGPPGPLHAHTRLATWVFYPVKEVVAKDPDNWWKSAENHIGNGPFKADGDRRGPAVDL
ncbi:MAG: hypothetical protein U0075_07965 [Thermomicrobiales bacterium]